MRKLELLYMKYEVHLKNDGGKDAAQLVLKRLTLFYHIPFFHWKVNPCTGDLLYNYNDSDDSKTAGKIVMEHLL